MDERRWRLVIVHEDTDVAEVIGELCLARGFEVSWSSSYEPAIKRIEKWPADIVVTAWDRPLGQRIYRWGMSQGAGRRFAFVVDEIAPRLERAVAQQRAARIADHPAIAEMVMTMRRRQQAAETAQAAQATQARPRLLLVEDDPAQRSAMTDVLLASGYDVVAADGVHAAVAALGEPGIEGVLSDWCMADGSGAELRNWISSHRPEMLDSLVFITGGDATLLRESMAPVPVLPKGQDSASLVTVLKDRVRSRQ